MLRMSVLCLCALILSGCGGGGISEQAQASVKQHYAQALKEFDPLCVYQGPFPWRPSKSLLGCDRCEMLSEFGLVTRASSAAPNAASEQGFDLSDDGKALYRDDFDAAYAEIVEARLAPDPA